VSLAAGHDTLVKPLDLTAPAVRCGHAGSRPTS
jgi:hypothetical protein